MERLKAKLGGWVGYFALAETPSVFERLESSYSPSKEERECVACGRT
ncbi:MAG: hypothetical protein QME87_07325 [Bacillota bacterium]|nr:hypothetical protein [Bacillota bacterium]